MRYFVGGSGPPLLLLHGLGGTAANWNVLAPPLAARFTLLVPDLPGHGGSAPLAAVPGLGAFADRIALVAKREGLLPAAAVGHSLGGAVALRLALRQPNAVTALVLAAAAGISSASRRAEYALTLSSIVQPGRRLAPFSRQMAARPRLRRLMLGGWGVADAAALSPRAAESFLASPRRNTDTRSAARALVAEDPRLELGSLRCPCLVLWGAADRQLPLTDAFEYARRLGAPLRVIPDCGHLLIGERPDACLDAIVGFLVDGATGAMRA